MFRPREPDYEKKGEGILKMRIAAFIFLNTFSVFKAIISDKDRSTRSHHLTPSEFEERIVPLAKTLITSQTTIAKIEFTQAINDLKKLYTTPEYTRNLLRLKEHKDDLLITFTETDVLNLLDNHIKNATITSKSTVAKLVSNTRTVFKLIGRGHPPSEGQELEWNGEILGTTNNPVTSSITKTLKIHMTAKKEKLGKPISAPVGFIVVIYLISTIIDKLIKTFTPQPPFTPSPLSLPPPPQQTINQIINDINMTMMYAILLHQACRAGEIEKKFEYTDISLPLHEDIPFLTLVFIAPSTLAYLIKNNKITHYIISPYKGKKAAYKLSQLQAIVPYPYNSIDLLSQLIVCLKARFFVSTGVSRPADAIATNLMFKQNLNFSSKRARSSQSILSKFDKLTYYSFRYAAAEEDAFYKIDDSWTRMRMGHTDISNMKDAYASKNDRLNFGDHSIALAPDVATTPTYPSAISLELNIVSTSGVTYVSSWLDDTFSVDDPAKEDFLSTTNLVRTFLSTTSIDPSTRATAYTALIEKFKKEHKTPQDILHPLGFYIKLREDMVPEELLTIFEEAKEKLKEPSNTATQPPTLIPELWSFPQLTYGNWRNLITLNSKTKENIPTLIRPPKPQQPAPLAKPAPQTTLSAPSTRLKKPRTLSNQPSTSRQPPYTPTPNSPTESTTTDDSWDDGFNLNSINAKDIVIIYCTTPKDRCALKLPPSINNPTTPSDIPNYVFIAECSSIKLNKNNPKKATFKGYFYFNPQKDATSPVHPEKKIQTITVFERSIIDVYAADSITTRNPFELSIDNIESVLQFLKEHW